MLQRNSFENTEIVAMVVVAVCGNAADALDLVGNVRHVCLTNNNNNITDGVARVVGMRLYFSGEGWLLPEQWWWRSVKVTVDDEG